MKNNLATFNIDPDTEGKFFKKGDILQRQGDAANRVFYVCNGLLKSYSVDSKGKEHIFMFAPEGWIVADIESLEFNQPAQLLVECMEDSKVIAVNRTSFGLSGLPPEQLIEQITLLSRRLGVLQRRLIMMMSSPAKDRYEHFLETYPELPNRVSQKSIASYLGITPEALSKIRGEISRTK